LSDGGVHSHIDHIIALERLQKKVVRRYLLHLITDGRDVPAKSAISYIEEIEKELPSITIAI